MSFGDRQLMTPKFFFRSSTRWHTRTGRENWNGPATKQRRSGGEVCWWCRMCGVRGFVCTHVFCCWMAMWWEVPWYKRNVVWVVVVSLEGHVSHVQANLFMWNEVRPYYQVSLSLLNRKKSDDCHWAMSETVYHRMLVCLVPVTTRQHVSLISYYRGFLEINLYFLIGQRMFPWRSLHKLHGIRLSSLKPSRHVMIMWCSLGISLSFSVTVSTHPAKPNKGTVLKSRLH